MDSEALILGVGVLPRALSVGLRALGWSCLPGIPADSVAAVGAAVIVGGRGDGHDEAIRDLTARHIPVVAVGSLRQPLPLIAAVHGGAAATQLDPKTDTGTITVLIGQDARSGRFTVLVGLPSEAAESTETFTVEATPRQPEIAVITPLKGIPGPPLDPSIRALASRLGLGEVFVLVGSPGATMTALALAQDLIALDRADQVVVCGSDLVGGALASALRLLRCTDRPSMRGGAIAVTLARRSNGHPTVERCWLGSPMVPAQPGIPIDLGDIGPVWAVPPPQEVVLSGLTSADLACARQLASRIWPSAAVSGRAGQRSVAADVLHIVACGKPTGVAAVHSLGGTGWCLMS